MNDIFITDKIMRTLKIMLTIGIVGVTMLVVGTVGLIQHGR